MADISSIKIRKLQSSGKEYYYAAKALLDATDGEHTYEEIVGLIEGLKKIGFEVVKLTSLPTANAAAFESYEHSIVLIEDATSLTGACIEYVILRSGTEGSYTYAWEKIGTTSTDLTNYLTYNLQYNNAALSAGTHKHTVTVPTVTKTATKLSATAKGTVVGADGTATVVKSYPGASSKLVTQTVTPAVSNGTASKASAGTAVTYGNANVGDAVAVGTSLSGTKTFVTGVTEGSAASWSASVSDAGVLSFSWTANTPSKSSGTGTVGLSTTQITPAAASTSKITPYTFTDVDVATVGEGVTVATGALASNGTGSSVLTGLGTASTETVLTGVKVTTQPTVTLANGATGDVDVISAVEVGSTTANTSETGAHTHNVKMTK